jgi:hypothetical protein
VLLVKFPLRASVPAPVFARLPVPLMLVAVIADGIAMLFMPNSSIMTEKLARRLELMPERCRYCAVGAFGAPGLAGAGAWPVVSGTVRPAVFGASDGLVSNFALIAGVAGAKADSTAVSLAGLAGLVGGAFSMATGEYVSVQSQNESANAEIEIERRELRVNAAAEQAELAQSYVDRGVEPGLANQVAEQISRDPDEALSAHAMVEFGVNPSELPSPWTAAGSSFASFTVGAMICARHSAGLDCASRR